MKAFRMAGPGAAGVVEIPDAVAGQDEVLPRVKMVGDVRD